MDISKTSNSAIVSAIGRAKLKINCNSVRILVMIAFKTEFVNSHLLKEHVGLCLKYTF
jgi:hypothetical protein